MSQEAPAPIQTHDSEEEVSNKICTLPNIISFIRLCMVPIFLFLVYQGKDVAATMLFAFAAGTDFVDGQLARRTHCVSKLGQILDPAVDRILMISGVVALLFTMRLPVWIVVLVLVRDLALLLGGSHLLKHYHIRIPVIYLGKCATSFLFIGCVGLLFNAPRIAGLGWVTASWLPGFNTQLVSWGIWFIYAGLLLSAIATCYYIAEAIRKVYAYKHKK